LLRIRLFKLPSNENLLTYRNKQDDKTNADNPKTIPLLLVLLESK